MIRENEATQETRVTVFQSPEAAEHVWRRLEGSGVLTPYQRYDWVKHLNPQRGAGEHFVFAVFQGEDPVALLPLVVDRFVGLRRGRFIGAEISNSDWLITSRANLMQCDLVGLLHHLHSEPCRVDFVELLNQPKSWQGRANPLLQHPHQCGPDHLYRADLNQDPAVRLDAKRHRNLRRGRRRLEETMGPVRLVRARSADEIARFHEAFLVQRNSRFDRMGMNNPFARDDLVSFFRAAAEGSVADDRPALAFHALLAGGEIVATSIGSYCGTHYSQFINSNAEGAAARYSLMGILMLDLLKELWDSGIRTIDLGLGDFEYKLDWADPEDVYDSFLPLTWQARLLVPTLAAMRRGKRRIKQDEVLWPMAKRLRTFAHRTLKLGTGVDRVVLPGRAH